MYRGQILTPVQRVNYASRKNVTFYHAKRHLCTCKKSPYYMQKVTFLPAKHHFSTCKRSSYYMQKVTLLQSKRHLPACKRHPRTRKTSSSYTLNVIFINVKYHLPSSFLISETHTHIGFASLRERRLIFFKGSQ